MHTLVCTAGSAREWPPAASRRHRPLCEKTPPSAPPRIPNEVALPLGPATVAAGQWAPALPGAPILAHRGGFRSAAWAARDGADSTLAVGRVAVGLPAPLRELGSRSGGHKLPTPHDFEAGALAPGRYEQAEQRGTVQHSAPSESSDRDAKSRS